MSHFSRQSFSNRSLSSYGSRSVSQQGYSSFASGGGGASSFGLGGGSRVGGASSFGLGRGSVGFGSTGLFLGLGGGSGGGSIVSSGGRLVSSQALGLGTSVSASSVGLGFGAGAGGAGFGLGGGAGGAGFGLGGGAGICLGGGGGFGLGGGEGAGALVFVASEKQQLQTLNNRLATYLEKVKLLERTNRELEEKLKAFTANQTLVTYDLKGYDAQLRPLREQLLTLLQETTRIALELDNTKLTLDDFRVKYENEVMLRQSVESDLSGLRVLKRDYELAISSLRQDVQALTDMLTTLQKTHEQEVMTLRGEMSGTVTVDVKAVESTDLSRVLADIRAEYETVVERNRREAESWYTKQVELKQVETAHVTETAVSGSSEVTESRKESLTLQTQLDSVLIEKTNMEQRLVEVQAQYQTQLLSLSRLAGGLEGELAAIRERIMQQSRDYQVLLSTKVQLEQEIATYKTLLEGAGDLSSLAALRVAGVSSSSSEVKVGGVSSSSSELKVSSVALETKGSSGSVEVDTSMTSEVTVSSETRTKEPEETSQGPLVTWVLRSPGFSGHLDHCLVGLVPPLIARGANGF
ncbi:keratin, type I cytoskeletal 13 [Chanos chanos]|uniref:Keratin, type I cytoskeletal 13 n=1 Tax=Chanos chanos TaxID=29144 RepID=A0A6J2VVW9_CHACN|nr:keratin, type I cytoskeletal 13-like [Chanos chanos]